MTTFIWAAFLVRMKGIVRFDWKFYNSLILSSEFCAFAGEKQNEGNEAEELFAKKKISGLTQNDTHPIPQKYRTNSKLTSIRL